MSEKLPEIIYMNVPNSTFLKRINKMGADVLCMTTDEQMTEYSIPYILKQTHDKEVADLKAEIERLKDCIRLGHECIKIWIKHNNEEIDVMDREFLLQSEQLLK